MASNGAALALIQEHVSGFGNKMALGDVIEKGGDAVAGFGFDTLAEVAIPGLDDRVFPRGVLSGELACRAVLLEPGVTARFLPGEPDLEGVVYTRTRFKYEEPRLGTLPARDTLTAGGSVVHVGIHTFRLGDGARLDEYFAELGTYETARANGSQDAVRPVRPAIHSEYSLAIPGIYEMLSGANVGKMTTERLGVRRLGFNALQARYPSTRVLSYSSQGELSQTALWDWAVAFTGSKSGPA